MSSVVIAGDVSGSVTLQAPSAAGTTTLTLPATSATIATNVNGDLYPLVSGTAVASTSGTSITFTGIPSWVKRITVMFTNVSTNGSSYIQVQLGSTTFTTSGYVASAGVLNNANSTGYQLTTTGFVIDSGGMAAAYTRYGQMTMSLVGSNTWVYSYNGAYSGYGYVPYGGGGVTIGGTLDRVRITTVNGTDTFDAGSINILYE